MATKKEQRKTEDENHEFKVEWTENFAFIQNLNGLPTCLICPKEELLGLLPLKDQTRGEDIANALIKCMDKHHVPLDKVVSISTDGAKSMTGPITELKISLFEINIGSFEVQLLDLKNKEIWRSKFECLCVELEILKKKKCDLSSQHKWYALNDLEKEDMIISNVWNSIPDSYDQLKKLALGVLSLFGSTYTECFFSSDEAHLWLNGYVNKQNCRIWSEANPQVYVETPLHPEKLTVWCALWAGGILLQKR
ncbi:uncharacterized protein TNCV_2160651 [Trichonephila clavipes]|nr:uncharacterized protein TNCV_2160651 [Trichonephila clavipes]